MSDAADRPDIIVGTVPKNRESSIRVTLREYHGIPLVDVRIFLDAQEGTRATKKGVAVTLTRLPALIQLLQQAQRTAAEHGLLETRA